MARRNQESGPARQRRLRRERHRPEQNRGDDEAGRGGSAVRRRGAAEFPRSEAGVADERPDRMLPVSPEESQLQNTTEDVDEREARRAREHDRSASRPGSREP